MSQSQVIHTPYGTLYYDNKNSWRFPGSREQANTAHAWAWRQSLLHDDKPTQSVFQEEV